MNHEAADHVIDRMNRLIRAAELNIRTKRSTGFHDATGLRNLGKGLAAGGGLVASFAPPSPVKAAGLAAAGTGVVLVEAADFVETIEKFETKVRGLNEVLDAYSGNLKELAENARNFRSDLKRDGTKLPPLGEVDAKRIVLEDKNKAITGGLADAWARLVGNLGVVKKFPERLADSAEQEIVRQIESVRDAFAEIVNMADDPKAARLLSRIQEYLERIAPAAPSTPTVPMVDEFRYLQTPGNERLTPGPTSQRGRSLWGNSVASLKSPIFDDANPIATHVEKFAEEAKAATLDLTGMNDEVARYKDSIRTMATGIADSNVQLAGQADWLTTVGGLLPGVGQRIIDLFGSGVEGAEEVDRAVAAMGTRFLDAFEGAILRGESLGDTLKSLGRDLANLALNELKSDGFGIFGKLGDLFTSAVLPAAGGQSGPHKGAKGLVFTNARLDSFARGGAFDMGARIEKFAHGSAFLNTVVNRPTLFPMANGAGLMGEAGAEAVVPLTRMANGDLGVSMPGAPPAAGSGGTVNITINAPGASLEGLRAVAAEVRELKTYAIQVSNSIEPRAINAINWRRSRGPW